MILVPEGNTLVSVLVWLFIASVVIGMVKKLTAVSGLLAIVIVPWITVLAYRDGYPWLAGAFTFICMGLLMRVIKALNDEL